MTTVSLGKVLLGRKNSGSISKNIYQINESWYPKYYVRYVVKWKGMQASEVTWEYWKKIKQDYVDLSEEFWQRQQPTTVEKVKPISERPHPHVRYFKKLSVLPSCTPL